MYRLNDVPPLENSIISLFLKQQRTSGLSVTTLWLKCQYQWYSVAIRIGWIPSISVQISKLNLVLLSPNKCTWNYWNVWWVKNGTRDFQRTLYPIKQFRSRLIAFLSLKQQHFYILFFHANIKLIQNMIYLHLTYRFCEIGHLISMKPIAF